MEAVGESESCKGNNGYGKPPWRFKGSAVYQFHLVKSEVARPLIPKEFTLVEAFGYTLGGFFLAKYEDSPVGAFDELVVIAGLVWNPPTSCAWAANVFVNNIEACAHGRMEVGLPSHIARFSNFGRSREQGTVPTGLKGKRRNFQSMIRMASGSFSPRTLTHTQVTEIGGPSAADIFSINMISSASEGNSRAWTGPFVNMSLPSFSGRTEHNPSLLKYSCQMKCRVRLVESLDISGPSSSRVLQTPQLKIMKPVNPADEQSEENRSHLSLLVMLSKPVLALEFSCMEMNVEAPLIISP